jgi:hypothetical protein
MKRSIFFTLVSGLWILASQNSHAILDINNNGLSDLWEKTYNNNLLFTATFSPQADPDGDGWTNLQEATAGTDPLNANPPSSRIQPNQVHVPAVYITGQNGKPELLSPESYSFTWPTKIGKGYTLFCSTVLTPGSWLALDVPLIGNGNIMGRTVPITHPDGSIPEKLFWRVAVTDTDSDGDGLTNAEESHFSSNSLHIDTDGDGRSDFFEANGGTDLLINQFLANPESGGLVGNLATSLRAVWGFESYDSANRFPNMVGSLYPARPNGTVVQSAIAAGPLLRTAAFDNVQDYLEAPLDVTTPSTNAGTVAFWFKGVSSSTDRYLFCRDYGTLPMLWCGYNAKTLVVQENGVNVLRRVGFFAFGGGHPFVASGLTTIRMDLINPAVRELDDDKWHHVVISINSSSVRLIIDGVSSTAPTTVAYEMFKTPTTSGNPSNPAFKSGFYIGTLSSAYSNAAGFTSNLNAALDQVIIYQRALSVAEANAIYNLDTDGDGVSNRAEFASGANPFVYETDLDNDGLANSGEFTAQTNPLDYDSDDDLLPDGWEVTNTLNPRSAVRVDGTTGDPDLDGIQNQYEYVLNLNPKSATTNGSADLSSDRDGDGIPDHWEAATSSLTYDPILVRSVFVRKLDWEIPDGLEDFDEDGYCNLAEFLTGNNPIIFTPGGLVDLDGDELTVGQEALYGSNLNLADTNGDGLNDGVSAQAGINPASLDSDNDGLTNVQEIALGTNPLIADTDGDGVLDSADAFPWDSSRTLAPPPTAGDTSPPMITITTPEGATEL